MLQLRRVFRIVNGGTPTSDPQNWDGNVPWVTPADLADVNGSTIGKTARTLTVTGLRSGSAAVPSGSLIISTRAPIGYVAATSTPTAFNQGCRGLIPRFPKDTRYFQYELLAMADILRARGQGSTFVELSSDSLASIRLYSPDPQAQQIIANHLDVETTDIDVLVAKKRDMINKLEARFREFRWLQVSCGVNGVNQAHNGAPPRRLSTWSRTRLKYLIDKPASGTWGSEPGVNEIDSECVRVADFDRWHGTTSLKKPTIRSITNTDASHFRLRKNDLLLEKSGGGEKQPVGFVARFTGSQGPAICSNFIARLRPRSDCDPIYLGHVLASIYDRGLSVPFIKQSTGIQNLDLDAFLAQRWAVPTFSEQVLIVLW
jgi:type I restriction enzyme S subunit